MFVFPLRFVVAEAASAEILPVCHFRGFFQRWFRRFYQIWFRRFPAVCGLTAGPDGTDVDQVDDEQQQQLSFPHP